MTYSEKLFHEFWKQLVHSIAMIEIPALTYLQTELVLENLKNNLRPSDIRVIINIGWALNENIISNTPLDIESLKQINLFVGVGLNHKPGVIREEAVRIGGTRYIPPMIKEYDVIELINEINKIEDPETRAATFLAKASKKQIFTDGNKRTALLAANKILFNEDAGIIVLAEEFKQDYFKFLLDYYEDETKLPELVEFIKGNAFKSRAEQYTKFVALNSKLESLKNAK